MKEMTRGGRTIGDILVFSKLTRLNERERSCILLEFCVGFDVLGRYPGCFATGMAFFLVDGIFFELIFTCMKYSHSKRLVFMHGVGWIVCLHLSWLWL